MAPGHHLKDSEGVHSPRSLKHFKEEEGVLKLQGNPQGKRELLPW